MQPETTILVVDDDPLGRQILEILLTREGYRLVMADSGVRALDLVDEYRPDLIILDMMMPGMDGLEVCRRLRSNARWAEVPVIMATALVDQDVWLSGIEAGVDDFITKPFDRMTLRGRVRALVRLSRYRRLYEEEKKRGGQVVGAAQEQPIEYQRSAALAKLALAINQPHELQNTLDQVVTSVTDLLPAGLGASIVLWDEDKTDFTVSATTVPEQENLSPAKQVRRRGGASRWIADNRRPFVEPDTARPTIPVNSMIVDYGVKAYAGIPLLDGERCLGILYALENHPRSYEDEDLQFLQDAADRAAVAVSKVQAYEQLMLANAELARASRMKDEFLANMSHELRTPLNAILNLSEALLEEVFGQVTPMQVQPLESITSSGRHLLELITDILDLSKTEAGKMTLDIEPVDVRAVCEASISMMSQMARSKNQRLHLQIDPACKLVAADMRRLRQMLVNLLSNAIKFTNPSGEIGIEVSINEAGDHMLFCVWDTGAGIANEDMDQLFQPFTQLDSGLARSHSGTGLGLALVKRMVGLHQGKVHVESGEVQGSRFTIELPVLPMPAMVPEWEDHPGKEETGVVAGDPSSNGRHSILVTEDNQVNAFAISTYLESKGYRILLAADGTEAMTIVEEQHPELILMDIQMPGTNGLDVIRWIRDRERGIRTPIIALTALARESDQEACLAAGADAYMAKPLLLESLVIKIEELLAIRNCRGE